MKRFKWLILFLLITVASIFIAISGFYINENTSSVVNWLNNEINITNEEYTKFVGDTTSTISSLNEKISTLELENSELKGERDSLTQQVEDLEDDLTASEETIVELNNKISELNDKITENERTIEELQSLINSMNAEVLASTVDVPEAFAGISNVYYIQAGDVLLFTGYNLKGLWIYDIDSSSWTQEFSDVIGNWSHFYIVENKCFILGTGFFVYDIPTGELLYCNISSTLTNLEVVNNKVLILGTKAISYDLLTNTYIQLDISGTFTDSKTFVFKDKIIVSSTVSEGVDVYDSISDSFVAEYTSGKNVINYIVLENKCLMSANSSSDFTGILIYDYISNTFELGYELGYKWTYYQIINDRCLLSSGSNITSCNGVLVYDSTLGTFEYILTTSYQWKFTMLDNQVMISNGYSSSGCGLSIYDYNTNAIVASYTKASSKYMGAVKIGDRYIIGSYSNTSGLLVYDPINLTIESFYSSGSSLCVFVLLDDVCFVSSDTISTSSSYSGLYVIDLSDISISKVYSGGACYDQVSIEDGKYYLSSSNKEKNPRTLCYDPTDGTVKLVKYYVEITE